MIFLFATDPIVTWTEGYTTLVVTLQNVSRWILFDEILKNDRVTMLYGRVENNYRVRLEGSYNLLVILRGIR